MEVKHKFSILGASILLASCSSGGGCNNCTTAPPSSAALLTFTTPYLIPSFESQTSNGYVWVNNPESDTISNISYNLSSVQGGGSLVTLDSSTTSDCATIESHTSCLLNFLVPANTLSGSLRVSANNGVSSISLYNKLMAKIKPMAASISQSNSLLIGIQPVRYTSTSGIYGIDLFYYPSVINGTSAIIVVGVLASNNVGQFNMAELLDTTGTVLSGQSIISGNLGAGKPNLVQGNSFSIALPLTSLNLAFKLKISLLDSDGALINSQTSLDINEINILTNQALVYAYPQITNLTTANPSATIVFSNLGNESGTSFTVANTSGGLVSIDTPAATNIPPYSSTQTNDETQSVISLVNSLSSESSTSLSMSYMSGVNTLSSVLPVNINLPQTEVESCNWQEVGDYGAINSNGIAQIALSPDGETLYATGYGGGEGPEVYRIDAESGQYWTSVGIPKVNASPYHRLDVLTISPDGSTLYTGGESRQGDTQVSSLKLGAEVWVQIGEGAITYTPSEVLSSISVSPDGSTLYAGGGYQYSFPSSGFLVSAPTSGSGAWASVANFASYYSSMFVTSFAWSGDGSTLYAGGFTLSGDIFGSVIKRSANSDWSPVAPDITALSKVMVSSLTVSGNTLYFGGTNSDTTFSIIESSTAGTEWQSVANSGSIFGVTHSITSSGNTIYAGGEFESRVISTNSTGSIAWTKVGDADTEVRQIASQIIASPRGNLYAVAGYGSDSKIVKLICTIH